MAAGFYGYKLRSFPRNLYQTPPSKLGVLANSDPSHNFCCGGKLSVQQKPILIRYKSNEKLAEVILPGADHNALRKLLDACSVNVSNGAPKPGESQDDIHSETYVRVWKAITGVMLNVQVMSLEIWLYVYPHSSWVEI